MPNIRTYEAPKVELRPNNAAAETAQGARATAAGFESFGQKIGQGISDFGQAVEDYQSQQEISRGLKQAAEIQDNTTTAWNVTINQADPNDPTTAEKFRAEQVDPILDAWVSEFHTKQGKLWATEHAAQVRQHFFEKTAADQASRAGQAAVQNFVDFSTSMSNSVLQDPTSMDAALGTGDTAIEALIKANPNIDPAVANKMRGELRAQYRQAIGVAAGQSMARANPDAFMADVTAGWGKDVLDADTRDKLYGFAQQQKRSQEADQRAAQSQALQARKQEAQTRLANLTANIVQSDGTLAVGPGYFTAITDLTAQYGDVADPGEVRAAINMGRAILDDQSKGTPAVTDPQVYNAFTSRMLLDPSNPRALTMAEIYQARADGHLSDKDFTFFKQSRDDLKTDPSKVAAKKDFDSFLDSYKSYITKSSLLKADAPGDQRYYEFYSWASAYHDREIAAGHAEKDVRANITAQLPRFQIGQQQALDYLKSQAHGGVRALPPVVVPTKPWGAPDVRQVPVTTTAPAVDFNEMDRVANGGK